MGRVLAGLHVGLALVALGIGNAIFNGSWESPALLHMVLGVSLFFAAVALWRQSGGVVWATALNLGVGGLVALTLVLDRLEGAALPPTGFVLGAIGFVVLEALTLWYATRSTAAPRGG